MSKQIEYIDTGIPYCPQIPNTWEVKRLKFVGKSIIGITYNPTQVTDKENGILVLRSSNVQNGTLSFEDNVYVNAEISDKHLSKEGDILICARNGSAHLVGKSAYIPKEYEGLTFGAFMLMFRSNLGKFMYYVFNSNLFKSQTGLFATSTINQLTSDTINNLFVALPKEHKLREEIANFLDIKTAELDKLISQKLELIDCLKEERIEIINQAVIGNLSNSTKKKPSGFDWVPTIPNDWTTNKIKNIAKIFGRIGYRGYQTSDLVNEGEGAITLSPSNMKEFAMDFSKCTYLSWFKYNESPEIQIDNGDILFVKTGSTYGKTSLVKNLPEKATINPQLLVFKEVKINTEFFYYVLLSQLIQAQVSVSVIGGTIPTISQEKIGNYYLFVPPIKEQDEIVALINKHLEHTNAAINKIEQEIDLINEYRAVLINEAVSGKITLN